MLYEQEVFVRTFFLMRCQRNLQLRVTGGWPDVRFTVSTSERVKRVPVEMLKEIWPDAVEEQPRLLRIEHRCPKIVRPIPPGVDYAAVTCITCGSYDFSVQNR